MPTGLLINEFLSKIFLDKTKAWIKTKKNKNEKSNRET